MLYQYSIHKLWDKQIFIVDGEKTQQTLVIVLDSLSNFRFDYTVLGF